MKSNGVAKPAKKTAWISFVSDSLRRVSTNDDVQSVQVGEVLLGQIYKNDWVPCEVTSVPSGAARLSSRITIGI